MANERDENLMRFLFEVGVLSRTQDAGWKLVGEDTVASVSDHALRAAQVAFFLALEEQYQNPYEVVAMAVFHEIHKARVGDMNKVTTRYLTADSDTAVREQSAPLGNAGQKVYELWEQSQHRTNIAGNIAKDAVLLEQAITAKEVLDRGNAFAADWIKNVSTRLQTASAKRLLAALGEVHSNDWWQGLKKIPPN